MKKVQRIKLYIRINTEITRYTRTRFMFRKLLRKNKCQKPKSTTQQKKKQIDEKKLPCNQSNLTYHVHKSMQYTIFNAPTHACHFHPLHTQFADAVVIVVVVVLSFFLFIFWSRQVFHHSNCTTNASETNTVTRIIILFRSIMRVVCACDCAIASN